MLTSFYRNYKVSNSVNDSRRTCKVELKQIIMMHSDALVFKLVKTFLEKEKTKIYHIDDSEVFDFKYLLDDLRPELLLIEDKFYNNYAESISAQLPDNIPLGLIITPGEPLPDGNWQVRVEGPFDPSLLHKLILEQL